jgi:hypothetical protein
MEARCRLETCRKIFTSTKGRRRVRRGTRAGRMMVAMAGGKGGWEGLGLGG